MHRDIRILSIIDCKGLVVVAYYWMHRLSLIAMSCTWSGSRLIYECSILDIQNYYHFILIGGYIKKYEIEAGVCSSRKPKSRRLNNPNIWQEVFGIVLIIALDLGFWICCNQVATIKLHPLLYYF